MKYFLIDRLTRNLPIVTIGKLSAIEESESGPDMVQNLGYTCELPYLSNQAYISCIPPGNYDLIRHVSETKGTVLAIQNFELGVTLNGPSQRTYCYFHEANYPEQLEGCIAPGRKLHPDKWGVSGSKSVMKKMLELYDKGFRKLSII